MQQLIFYLQKERKVRAEVKDVEDCGELGWMKTRRGLTSFLFYFLQLLSALFAVTFAGVIHDYSGEHHEAAAPHDGETAETEHHHHVNHKHAESHQSVKFIHYHAVPVYVKKEDQKYLAHPVEIGSNKHKLKLVHPETEKSKGYGLTLENHSEYKNHKIEHHPHEDHHGAGSESHEQTYEQQPEFDFEAYEAAHH